MKSTKLKPSEVVIHVCDEARKVEKDFVCERKQLVAGMRYFVKYLETDPKSDSEEVGEVEDVDIAVHCDVVVFEWLIAFVKGESPKLAVANVISILISSDFLEMAPLVSLCLQYTAKHLSEVIQLPLDLSCVSGDMLCALAAQLTLPQLDAVKDANDKLLPQLYRCKLSEMASVRLDLCAHCAQLLTPELERATHCVMAPAFISFNGAVTKRHCGLRLWDLEKYFLAQRLSGHIWREIAWHFWALSRQPLHCAKCGAHFSVLHLQHCATHSMAPHSEASGEVVYGCCGLRLDSFNAAKHIVSERQRGCVGHCHSVATEAEKQIVEMALTHASTCLIAFETCQICCTVPKRSVTIHSHSRITSPMSQSANVWDTDYYRFGAQNGVAQMHTTAIELDEYSVVPRRRKMMEKATQCVDEDAVAYLMFEELAELGADMEGDEKEATDGALQIAIGAKVSSRENSEETEELSRAELMRVVSQMAASGGADDGGDGHSETGELSDDDTDTVDTRTVDTETMDTDTESTERSSAFGSRKMERVSAFEMRLDDASVMESIIQSLEHTCDQ